MTRAHAAAGAVLLVAFGWSVAPASAERGRLADFRLGLTSRSPSAPTGFAVHVFFHRADDPDAKPSPLRSVVLRLPTGLRFDTSSVSECRASDDEIRLRGADACPPESQLTVGSFSAMTGAGPPFDPLAGDDHVFNGPNQIIEIITVPGGSASPAFDRLTIDGSTLTAHPPKAPGGPPEGESSVRSIDFQVPVRSGGGRSLITTPPDCPAGGQWTSTLTAGFADGSADTVASTTPCGKAPAAQSSESPQLRLAVHPRRVRAGRRVSLSFRVSSSAAECVSGARLRVGRHTVRTDRRGYATFATELHRTGARRVRATHAACGEATALVHVLAARRR